MSVVVVPRFGELLSPFISQVPAVAIPRFLALLERGAANRYRMWAAELPEATQTYYEAFAPYDIWDQLRIQANAERQGANAWRGIAANHDDPSVVAVLHSCSALEELSADALDALIALHAPTH